MAARTNSQVHGSSGSILPANAYPPPDGGHKDEDPEFLYSATLKRIECQLPKSEMGADASGIRDVELMNGADGLLLRLRSSHTEDGVRLLEERRVGPRNLFRDGEAGVCRLIFIIHLAGKREIELGHSEWHELNQPTFAVYYQPEDAIPNQRIRTRDKTQSAIFVDLWTSRPSRELCEALRRLANCPPRQSGSKWVELPLNSAMEQAAYQMLSPTIHKRWRREFLTLKAVELLYLGLDAMLPSVEGP
ncbi:MULTISPECIES: hypothetical protein [unclassified Bradyrhizobium]|uniref:hypothetical protein n=1 Tax=unclassified Bradyrhizobium TaxID=2631580 RepID=UPI001FF88FA2|nr:MULTISPECIES: hypothetical protein [unclassified Bradyrhizobium]MCK1534454.1 hypothetical protein [Bradyrhizobium sp. 176]MCK1555662.1 hypothetical protein [Bradyrhizobium sp. 171]